MKSWKSQVPLHFMMIPAVVLAFLFNYVPLAGISIAFQRFVPNRGLFGSKWIGLDNFRYVLDIPDIYQIVFNTVFIAVMKITAGLIVPIVAALLLNEMRVKLIKRSVQTLIYLPHFLSWVILGGILIDILSIQNGIVNQVLGYFGIGPIYFLGDNNWFPFTIVLSDVWKEYGFSTIVYLAALTAIDPSLYEAAHVDGAGRWKMTIHITLPGMMPIIILLAVLSLGNVLNAGFEQIFMLYNAQVYQSGDIIDTLVYRIAFQDAQYSVSTAVGLFKSVVSLVLIVISYRLAYRYANYRIF
ncbi:ABC transporter permease [Paenibacillus sp. MBLB4367]|uniref:ABC transporter permease n=1 Tax=Paenibacillus sp. MBLB4367 TaxID=3384767 RepID=UPI00390815DE